MSVPIRNIGSPTAKALAPGLKINSVHFAKLNVRTALSHASAAHAGEVGFSGHFQPEAAIEQMIPTVPFEEPCGIHRANEIANTESRRDKDLLRPHTV